MQIVRSFNNVDTELVGFGVRALVVATEEKLGTLRDKLSACGGQVEACDDLNDALNKVDGFDVLVVDCDACGGKSIVTLKIAAYAATVSRQMPILLTGSEFKASQFAMGTSQVTCLRAPVSRLAMRIGLEHALRDVMDYRIS